MREIKFRAWDKVQKKMRNSYELFSFDCSNEIPFLPLAKGLYSKDEHGYSASYEVMQYTGLHDKNGKEIYEGDIVKRHGYTDYNYCFNVSEIIGTVVYEDCGFVVKHFDKDNKEIKYITPFFIELSEYPEAIKHYEVIGNIYENPKMLESEINNE